MERAELAAVIGFAVGITLLLGMAALAGGIK